jgi:hypothetical protein
MEDSFNGGCLSLIITASSSVDADGQFVLEDGDDDDEKATTMPDRETTQQS